MTDNNMKHIPLGIIYGLISLISFLGNDMSSVSFDSVMMLISWIAIIAMIYSIQWFDKVTDGYFVLVILLFMASRLARYNSINISNPTAYIAIGIGMGLIVQCILNEQPWPAIFLISIFAIEVCVMEFQTELKLCNVDMTDFFPEFEFIDSKITLDPTTINWSI